MRENRRISKLMNGCIYITLLVYILHRRMQACDFYARILFRFRKLY